MVIIDKIILYEEKETTLRIPSDSLQHKIIHEKCQ